MESPLCACPVGSDASSVSRDAVQPWRACALGDRTITGRMAEDADADGKQTVPTAVKPAPAPAAPLSSSDELAE